MEEDDELMAEFINGHPDTVADDYLRLVEENGSNGFDNAMRDLIAEAGSSEGTLVSDALREHMVTDEPGTIKEASYGLENTRLMYLEDMQNSYFSGSYESYLDSQYFQDMIFDDRERAKEEISQLVKDWKQSPTSNAKDSEYLVVEGAGVDWLGESNSQVFAIDEFAKDPYSVLAQGRDDTAQDWIRDKYGNIAVTQTAPGWKKNEKCRIRALKDGEFFKDYNDDKVYAFRPNEDYGRFDESQVGEIVDYFEREGKFWKLEEILEQQGPGTTFDNVFRDYVIEALEEEDQGDRLDEFMDEVYGGDHWSAISIEDAVEGFVHG